MIAIIIVFVIGAMAGMVCTALCAASKRPEDR